MHWEPGRDVEEYLDYCRENHVVAPLFRGYAPFVELLKRERIEPYITLFRIMYTGVIDEYYCLDEEGGLLLLHNFNKGPKDPAEILSEEKHPDGWEVHSLRSKHLVHRGD